MMIKIAVGSMNPVKLQATYEGFAAMFPTHADAMTVQGVAVESGVSAQPIGDNETFFGASNRALAIALSLSDVDYAVGIEGGIVAEGDDFMAFAWVVVLHDGKVGRARTGGFMLPKEVSALLRDGVELGDADDIVFGQSNSKQEGGSIGLLTENTITRVTLYAPAVVMALIPFKNPHLTW